jgi:hypothetical protein
MVVFVLSGAFLVLPVADGLACGGYGMANPPFQLLRSRGEVSSAMTLLTLQHDSPDTHCPQHKHEQTNHCSTCLLHGHVLVNQGFPQIHLSSNPFPNLTIVSRLIEPIFTIYEPPKS